MINVKRFKKSIQEITYSNFLYKYIFGEDIFISYAREDGFTYAEFLAGKLKDDFSCYIDQYGNEHGVDLPTDLKRNLKNSRMLVVVGSEKACQSENVYKEIRYYIKVKKQLATIIPIDFGSIEQSIWFKSIGSIARSDETIAALLEGNPSPKIIDRIKNSYSFKKRADRTLLASILTVIALFVFGAVTVALTSFSLDASDQLATTNKSIEIQRDELTKAETKLSNSIANLKKSENQLKQVNNKLTNDSISILKLHTDSVNLNKAYQKTSYSLSASRILAKDLENQNKQSKDSLIKSNIDLSQAKIALTTVRENIKIQAAELNATNNLVKTNSSYSKKNYLETLKSSKQFLDWADSSIISKKKSESGLLNNKRTVESIFFESLNQKFPYAINKQFIEINDYCGLKNGYLILGKKRNEAKEKLYQLDTTIHIVKTFIIPDSIKSICYDTDKERVFLIGINSNITSKPVSVFELEISSGLIVNLSSNYKYRNLNKSQEFLFKYSSFDITNAHYYPKINKIFIETRWQNVNRLTCIDLTSEEILYNLYLGGELTNGIHISFDNPLSIEEMTTSLNPLKIDLINQFLSAYKNGKFFEKISRIHYYPENESLFALNYVERPASEAIVDKKGFIQNSEQMSIPVTMCWIMHDDNTKLFKFKIDLPDNNFLINEVNADSLIISVRRSGKNTGYIQYTDVAYIISLKEMINKNLISLNENNINDFSNISFNKPGDYRFTDSGDLIHQNNEQYNLTITNLKDFSSHSFSEYSSFKKAFYPKIITINGDYLSVSSDNQIILRKPWHKQVSTISFLLPLNKTIETTQNKYTPESGNALYFYRRLLKQNGRLLANLKLGSDSVSTLHQSLMINNKKNWYIHYDTENHKSIFFDETRIKHIELINGNLSNALEQGISANGNYLPMSVNSTELRSPLSTITQEKFNEWKNIDCVHVKFNSTGEYAIHSNQTLDTASFYKINLFDNKLVLIKKVNSEVGGRLFSYFLNDTIAAITEISPVKSLDYNTTVHYRKYDLKQNVILSSFRYVSEVRDTSIASAIHINNDSTLFFGTNIFGSNGTTGIVNIWQIGENTNIDTTYFKYDFSTINYAAYKTKPQPFIDNKNFPWIMFAIPPDYSHFSFWNFKSKEMIDFINTNPIDFSAGFCFDNNHFYYISSNLVVEDFVTPMLSKNNLQRIYESKIPIIID